MTEDSRWLEAHCAGAPGPLWERVVHFLLTRADSGSRAERLAGSARAALEAVVSRPGDRAVALDLLAADALVTLALTAQAEAAPADLDRFAAELLGD